MRALDNAPEGIHSTMILNDCISAIQNGEYSNDAILSEANAPLIKLGCDLMSKKIPCQMRTEKLNRLIIRYCYRFLDTRKYQVGTMAEQLRKLQSENIECGTQSPDESLEDVIKVVDALEQYCLANGIIKPAWKFKKPVHPIQQALEQFTNSNKGITLLTGHTAKGLEWNTVFYLEGKMRKPESDHEIHQAECLAHVIDTRAKLNYYKLITD